MYIKRSVAVLLDHAVITLAIGLVSILISLATTYIVIESPSSPPPSESSGGSSGGGGGGGGGALTGHVIIPSVINPRTSSNAQPGNEKNPQVCISRWVCSGWDSCNGEYRSRSCYDENKCDANKPTEYTYCGAEIASPEKTNVLTGFIIANGGTGSIVVGSLIGLTMGSVVSAYVIRRMRRFGWVKNKYTFSINDKSPQIKQFKIS